MRSLSYATPVMRIVARGTAALLVCLIHVAGRNEGYSAYQAVLAGFVGSVLLIAVDVERLSVQTRRPPVLVWALLQIYVFFALPVFTSVASYDRVLPWSMIQARGGVDGALLGGCIVTGGMLLGWAALDVVARRARPAAPIGPRASLPMGLLGAYALLSILVTFVLRKYEWEVRSNWYRAPLAMLFAPVLAQALIAYEWQRGDGRSRWLWLLGLTTGVASLAGLLLGRLSYALLPVAFYVMARFSKDRRVPMGVIVGGMLLFLVFNPVKILFRGESGYRTDEFAQNGVGEMVEIWADSFQKVWGEESEVSDSALDASVERFSFMETNAVVMARSPDEIPFAHGETWWAIPYSVIPRVIWAEKPDLTEITNDVFSIRFGFATEAGTERSTMAYPIVADGYWNFGMWGVLLVGFLVGIFWRLILWSWSSGSRVRYVLALIILLGGKSVVALPNLLIGVPQQVVVGLGVVFGLEILRWLFGGMVIVRPNRSGEGR